MEDILPKNWVHLKFTNVLDIKGGSQPPKSQFIDEQKEGYIRLLQIRDFGSKPVPTYIRIKENQLSCKKDDILIARYGASIGRIVTGMEGSYNVALAKVIIPDPIPKAFVKWYLKSNIFQMPITSTQRTAQNGFNKEDLESVDFPLPPLAEQERIVAKLDALFAQQEVMKKALAKIPTLLKDFRQQILTQAVTGKLTESWRKGNELEDWKDVSLGDISTKITDGAHNVPKVIEKGFPYLMAKDLTGGFLDFSQNNFIGEKDHKELYNKCKPERGDLLIVNIGAGTGNNVLINSDVEFSFKNIAIVKPKRNIINSNFLKFSFDKHKAEILVNQVRGGAQPFLSLTALKSIKISIPSLSEQQEIVSRVESVFAKADVIEQRYKNLKEKIETLPQAILHKAFKGELVAQLPTDGDANDLLKEILELKDLKLKKK